MWWTCSKGLWRERELNDIDIYVPDVNFQSVVDFGSAFIAYGPTHHLGAQWDLTYVKFNYQSQDIEVGSDKACKIFNHHQSKWITPVIDFQNYQRHNIFGVELRVMAKNDLLTYKKLLNRTIDIEAILAIEANP